MKKKKFVPQQWIENQNLSASSGPDSVSTSPREIPEESISPGQTPQSSTPSPKSPSADLGVNSQLPTVNRRRITENAVPSNDFSQILSRLEAAQTDITTNYADWRDIGFALADEFGENGRDYFHRVSRYYPGYSQHDCDKQYDACLKSNGHGITIKTFFHMAKQAGISLITTGPNSSPIFRAYPELASGGGAPENSGTEGYNPSASTRPDGVSPEYAKPEPIFNTPRIPTELYSQLPEILRESCEMFADPIEKDVLLIGALSVISGCIPNIEGIYFDEPVSAHLYSFITAPAGSGKGKLKWAKFFGMKIHKTMVQQSILAQEEYERELDNYNNLTKNQRQGSERPRAPKRKMFYIPANSSASAFIQALADNDFKGIIFETEADTLAGTLKQDWGNFSDVLRKAFHHESTNMFRRKDNEHIEVEDPHLAIALSGTPKQVHNMMPDVENGLFSRFLYYAFEDYSAFKNPFISHQKINYTEFFEHQGARMDELYQSLLAQPTPLRFEFTPRQGEIFTEQFNNCYQRNRMLLGNDFNANSRRLGLITFRIAMVLRTLRILEDGDYSNPLICNETDFQTAIQIAFTLEKHAIAVFQNLPNNDLKGVKLKFYNVLPDNFNRQDYLAVAKQLDIKEKTAEKYIGQFKSNHLLLHEHNNYTKPPNGK